MNFVRNINLIYATFLILITLSLLIINYIQRNKVSKFFGLSQKTKTNLFSSLILLVSFGLFILSYRGPYFSYDLKKMKNSGADISVVLDISNSMYAQDIAPSRLIRSKMAIKKLLNSLNGDRVSLVTFAGRAVRNSPLTRDYSSLEVFLNEVDPSQIPFQGTNINEAVKLGVKTLMKTDEDSRFLIFISDGESHKESLDEAVTLIRKHKIQSLVVSVGSLEGAPVPTSGLGEKKNNFKKDQYGNIVLSKANKSLLKIFSSKINGKFISGSNFDDQVYSSISHSLNKARNGGDESKRKLPHEIFQIFLIVAFILFVLSKYLMRKSVIMSLLILMVSSYQNEVKGFIYDKKSSLYKNKEYQNGENYLKKRISEGEDLFHELGDFYYRQKKFKKAQVSYLKSKKDDALYNAGNSSFKLNDFESAINFYEKFLEKSPSDQDAKYNLDLAKKMKENPQSKKNDSSEKNNKDKSKENQQQNEGKSKKEKNKEEQKNKKENAKNESNKKNTDNKKEDSLSEKNESSSENKNEEKKAQKIEKGKQENKNSEKKKNNNSPSEDQLKKEEPNKNQKDEKMSYRSKKLLNQVKEGRQKYLKQKSHQGKSGAYNGIDW